MNQNDALEINLKGLMPRLEAALERVRELELEVKRLRGLVPADQRQGHVLIHDEQRADAEEKTFKDRLRNLLAHGR